jgi:hypothetical protein
MVNSIQKIILICISVHILQNASWCKLLTLDIPAAAGGGALDRYPLSSVPAAAGGGALDRHPLSSVPAAAGGGDTSIYVFTCKCIF